MSISAVYITFSDKVSATKLVERLLEERLIACANIHEVQSSYWWQGAIATEDEFVAVMKTSNDRWPSLKAKAEEWHPYDVPCIVRYEVEANLAYEEWVQKEVQSPEWD